MNAPSRHVAHHAGTARVLHKTPAPGRPLALMTLELPLHSSFVAEPLGSLVDETTEWFGHKKHVQSQVAHFEDLHLQLEAREWTGPFVPDPSTLT